MYQKLQQLIESVEWHGLFPEDPMASIPMINKFMFGFELFLTVLAGQPLVFRNIFMDI